MKIFKKFRIVLIILLIFIACDEVSPPTITNTVFAYRIQEMFLTRYIYNKYDIRLYWSDYYGCNSYDISIPDIDYYATVDTVIHSDGSIHYLTNNQISDFYFNPGYCFKAYVNCSENQGLDEYKDSLIVNTQKIDPIEDINIHVADGGHKDSLTFTHSSDTDIYKWYFYNFQFDQNDSGTHPHYFEHIHNEQSQWQQDIHPFGWDSEWPDYGGTNKLDYYIYSKDNVDDSYCYMIQIEDDKGYKQNSHIKCSDNYTRNANNAVEIISTTNNLARRIVVEWEEYTDLDFYQYILWRSEYENMPEDSIEEIALIVNNQQTTYEDRYNVSDGKRWYYKLEVENQYGKSETSDVKSGITRP